MAKVYDLHMHTKHSQDAAGYSICQAAEKALGIGLAGMAVTDHLDICYAPIGFPFYFAHELERRMDFDRALEQFGSRLDLLYGVEIGHPYMIPEIAEPFLGTRRFDFILGSVHFLDDGRDIYEIRYTDEAVCMEVLGTYFRDMRKLIRFGGFDSLAHLDYPLRKMRGVLEPLTAKAFSGEIDDILEQIIRKDIALEINTRGLQDGRNTTEPEPWVLKRYFELGGRLLTIGSDAHTAERIGDKVPEAMEIASEIGFKSFFVYRDRKPEEFALA